MKNFTPFKQPDRAFITITGNDSAEFLQGQISNDIDLLKTQDAIHALILTPQGKILADLFAYNHQNGYLLDVHTSIKDWLIKRFNMFKLRSDVNFTDVSNQFQVVISATTLDTALVAAPDPRLPNIIRNIMAIDANFTTNDQGVNQFMASQAIIDFDSHYQASEHFPQDLWFDKLGSISFTKGCYVGQEVVSRMRHKSSARKRLMPLTSTKLHQKTDNILLDNKTVGAVICQVGSTTLAMLRMDKISETTTQLDEFEITRPQWIQNL